MTDLQPDRPHATGNSAADILVLPTDEEQVIARHVRNLIPDE